MRSIYNASQGGGTVDPWEVRRYAFKILGHGLSNYTVEVGKMSIAIEVSHLPHSRRSELEHVDVAVRLRQGQCWIIDTADAHRPRGVYQMGFPRIRSELMVNVPGSPLLPIVLFHHETPFLSLKQPLLAFTEELVLMFHATALWAEHGRHEENFGRSVHRTSLPGWVQASTIDSPRTLPLMPPRRHTLHEASAPLKAGGIGAGTIYIDGSYKQEGRFAKFITKTTTSTFSAAIVVHVEGLEYEALQMDFTYPHPSAYMAELVATAGAYQGSQPGTLLRPDCKAGISTI